MYWLTRLRLNFFSTTPSAFTPSGLLIEFYQQEDEEQGPDRDGDDQQLVQPPGQDDGPFEKVDKTQSETIE